MTTDHWRAMVAHLAGHKVHPLPGPQGRVHVAAGDELSFDDLFDCDSPTEVARALGVSKAQAEVLLQQRAERIAAGTVPRADSRGSP